MDAPQPFSSRELDFLRALVDEGVEFLVVGLAAAALQGAPMVTQDVDLWFRDLGDPAFVRALQRCGVAYVAPSLSNPPLLAGAGAELFDIVVHMHGLEDFATEAAGAVKIRLGSNVLPVLPLERIIKSKEAAGREKDRAVLPALRAALAVLRARKRR